ncbi:hypothetical protein PIB30_082980 [Stylosanthes scabra]|uniref:DUF223 domain-containing protein n=1 Tax=Stylosanthes scabra TaxID=79078 RepID=A0ABU6YSR5_9FABA|nr:hypothetical protein [Stylosanthes scabra]
MREEIRVPYHFVRIERKRIERTSHSHKWYVDRSSVHLSSQTNYSAYSTSSPYKKHSIHNIIENNPVVNENTLWDSPAKQNLNETQTIEIVAEDSKGQRIHIQVPKGLAKRWRPHLKDFQMYRITNVVVVDPRMRKNIKTIPCKWYLAFSHRTNVQHVENLVFPINPFRFKTHTQLLDENEVLPSHTFDFIGEVVGKENPRDVVTSTGRETKRMVIVLQDIENQRMNCIIFGSLVDDIAPHLQSDAHEPLILILQYFKRNFDLSKIHINLAFKAVNDFKEKLLVAGPTMSGRISQVTAEGGKNGVEELTSGKASVITIENLHMTKECETWISCNIVALNVGSKDWFYTTCAGIECAKKVSWSGVGDYKCPFCKKNTRQPTTR